MSSLIIVLAADHGGYELKAILKEDLLASGYQLLDLGTNGPEAVDYPDMAKALADAIAAGSAQYGVLICGTGIGISIAANRYQAVRAALVHDAFTAKLSRQHNDANVICFGGRTIGSEVAKDCLKIFLGTAFDGGERHCRRVKKLSSQTD